MINAGLGNGGQMNSRILGMAFISISIALLLASFYRESIVLLNYDVPLAGICLIFVVLSVLSFQHAEISYKKTQEKMNTRVEKQIGGLTNVMASDVKRETMFNEELRSQIHSVSAEMKTHDKELATGLKKQGKALAVGMKKQVKVNAEVKKSIKTIASEVKEVKKQKSNPDSKKDTGKPVAKKHKKKKK
jgi:ABC-type multidrug transport system fused ATPase/permease subunit